MPSLTVDPVALQTVGSKPLIPLPASTPTVDQPKVTINAAQNPPNEKGSDNSPRPKNDPASQGRPLLLPTLNAVGPNSDPKGNNDHQQDGLIQPSSDPTIESDPGQAIDPKKSNDSGRKSEDGGDPKPHSNPTQADSSHGSEQNVDPVSQGSDTEQTNEENPFNDFTEGQTKTINHQVIQPLSHGISIAGTTLTPWAPAITVSSTLIHFGPSALVIGTSTVPFVPANPNPDPLTTNIAGHVITAAAPNTIAVAGTTLTPGAPPITISGTPIHFASSALLIIGTSTLPLAPPAAPTRLITTISGQLITAAPSALTIAGTNLSPGSPGLKVVGTLISLDTASHQLIVGTKTIALLQGGRSNEPVIGGLASEVSANPLVNGHPITAVLVTSGTTLTPGAPALAINGTLVSLNAAAQSSLVLGSKTIRLAGSAGLGASMTEAGVSGSAGPSINTNSPNPTLSMGKGNVSTAGDPDRKGDGNGNGTNTAVQVFQGSAAALLEGWNKVKVTMALAMAMAVAVPVYIC